MVLPSLSFGPSVEVYYGARLPTLEHRFLLLLTMLRRLPGCEVVVVTSVAPDPAVWDYYLDLAGAGDRADVARRAHLVTAEDSSLRPLATTLLDRGDLLDRIRDLVAGRPGFIEPYNVTAAEVEVAVRLQLPVNGPAPALAPLGYKSGGRRVFAEAGVLIPVGREDVRSDRRGGARRARGPRRPTPRRARSSSSWTTAPPGWATWCSTCPTRDRPEGRAVPARATECAARVVRLRACRRRCGRGTHHRGQIRQPQRPGRHRTRWPDHHPWDPYPRPERTPRPHLRGVRVPGRPRVLGACGPARARGRPGAGPARSARTVQPGLRRDLATPAGMDRLCPGDQPAPGRNLPPLALLANLDPGQYQPDLGRWESDAGGSRCYRSTDNLLDPRWVGLDPARVIAAVRDAGLAWDRDRRTGVVLHLLSCLAVDGRMGLTAIAATPRGGRCPLRPSCGSP